MLGDSLQQLSQMTSEPSERGSASETWIRPRALLTARCLRPECPTPYWTNASTWPMKQRCIVSCVNIKPIRAAMEFAPPSSDTSRQATRPLVLTKSGPGISRTCRMQSMPHAFTTRSRWLTSTAATWCTTTCSMPKRPRTLSAF